MRRRRLLATLAALAGTAGCLSAPRATGDGTADGGTEQSPSPSSPWTGGTPDDGTPTPIPPDPDASFDEETFEMDRTPESPFAERPLGDRTGLPNPDDNKPHGVVVWNGVDREREVRVRVVGRDVGTLLDTAWTFPARGYVALTLNWPDTYRIRCTTGARTDEATVPQGTFDCNDSRTTVGVFGDGTVEQMTVSTTMACDAAPS
jgi:hypothetical protein